jgi:hypothetical protein
LLTTQKLAVTFQHINRLKSIIEQGEGNMQTKQDKVGVIVALAMVGGSVTGAVSFVAALFPLVEGDFLGVGLCLIAAALSFGLLANAVLRT